MEVGYNECKVEKGYEMKRIFLRLSKFGKYNGLYSTIFRKNSVTLHDWYHLNCPAWVEKVSPLNPLEIK